MRELSQNSLDRSKALGAALRAVRNHRSMGQSDVAAALGISRRSYLDAEAGTNRWPLEQLIAFADATNSDVMALVAAAIIGDPALAVRCADNKLMTILMSAVVDFEAAVGDRVGDLRPQELMHAVETVFGQLSLDLAERRVGEAWVTRLLARFSGGSEK